MKKVWLKATCPICDKEYSYLSDYKPKTCGRFECLRQYLNIKRSLTNT